MTVNHLGENVMTRSEMLRSWTKAVRSQRKCRQAKRVGHRVVANVESLEPRRVLAATITDIGGYESGIFDEGAAEAAAYSVASQRLYVGDQSNVNGPSIKVLDASDPTQPVLLHSINVSAFGAPTSIATHGNLVAVAIPNGADETLPGVVIFLDASDETGVPLRIMDVGPVPDYVTFTPDGTKVLTANEGQPDDIDPEGSVSVIDLSEGLDQATESKITFTKFNDRRQQLINQGVRFLPDRDVAQSLEPEYIAVHPNSNLAWVTLQENNAIAMINLSSGKANWIKGLGYKDHSSPGNGLDASDDDDAINIANWPVQGMYQPDAVTVYSDGQELYLVTANEGDGFADEDARVNSLDLDDAAFPNEAILKEDANLGRLVVSQQFGDTDGDGDIDQLYSFGSRSFSIWSTDGEQVFDSGDDFEQITAEAYPANFNASNTSNTFDNRSDDKGPEPTTVTVGEVGGRKYAFITVERTGGVMMYDVSDPHSPEFVQYVNTRDFTQTPGPGQGGDLHPENLVFVSADDSPTGEALLFVSYQVSGSVRIFEITDNDAAASVAEHALARDEAAGAVAGAGVPTARSSAEHNDQLSTRETGQLAQRQRAVASAWTIASLFDDWENLLRPRTHSAQATDLAFEQFGSTWHGRV
jgi:hypothetical protein